MQKRSRLFTIILLIGIISASQSVFGEEQLTLNAAIQKALIQHHRILAMEQQVQESKSNIGVARSQFYPQLNFIETLQSTNNPPQSFFFKLNERQLDFAHTDFNHPGTNTDYESRFQLTQPLFTGGRLVANLNIAKQETAISEKEKEKTREEIAYQVAQSYYNLIIAKEYLKVANTAVKNAHEHYRVALAQYQQGRGIKSDMLRAQVYLTQMEETLVKSSTQVEIGKRNLALSIGENPTTPVDTVEEGTYAPQTVEMQTVIQTGLANRIELQELDLRQAQILNQKKAITAERLPSISLVGSFQFNSEDAPFTADANSWYGAMLVSLPLFDGGARTHRLNSVTATARKLHESMEETKQQITFQISQSVLQLNAAQKRVELTQNIVNQAEESLRLMQIRYTNGLCSLTDLLDAQTALLQAHGDAIQAKAEYSLGLIAIDYNQGILTRNLMKN